MSWSSLITTGKEQWQIFKSSDLQIPLSILRVAVTSSG